MGDFYNLISAEGLDARSGIIELIDAPLDFRGRI